MVIVKINISEKRNKQKTNITYELKCPENVLELTLVTSGYAYIFIMNVVYWSKIINSSICVKCLKMILRRMRT